MVACFIPELTIIFEDLRDEKKERIIYHEPDGILGFIKDLNTKKEPMHDPVYIKGEAEGIEVEAAFQYVSIPLPLHYHVGLLCV